MAAAPVPLVLIKWTYVLVLLLSFSCLNSSFPCLDPAYHSKVSLERDTFKTFYCGLWTHAHVFDFKPSWAKYFGFLVHFSHGEVIMLVALRSAPERRGLHCLGGSSTGQHLSSLFSFPTLFMQEEWASFLTSGWKKNTVSVRSPPFCPFLGLAWLVLCMQNCHLFTRFEESPQPISVARRQG